MFNSIRWRIGLPYVILIILTMAGLGFYLSDFLRQTYLNNWTGNLTAEAQLFSELVKPLVEDGTKSRDLDSLAIRLANQLGIRLTVIDRNGTVLSDSHADTSQMDDHSNRPEIVQAINKAKGTSTRFSRTLNKDLMYVAVPVEDEGRLIAIARVALPLEGVENNILNLQRALISITLIITFFAILLAFWIANRSMRPLQDLSQAAVRITGGNLADAPVSGSAALYATDEIGQLTRSFNDMAIQLRSQIDALETERSKMISVLSVMTDGVLIIDTQGTVQLINPAAESIFGVNQDVALGRSLIETFREHQLMELWQLCINTGETQYSTIEIAPKNLYLQVVATPLGDALLDRTLMLFQNLTRIRRLETVRRDFVSNISHELRTPLASLKALTDTLKKALWKIPEPHGGS